MLSIKKFGKILLNITTSSFEGLGKATIMVVEVIFLIFKGNIPIKATISQMVEVGWKSIPIIFLTSLFTGMVLALQVGSITTNLFNEPIYVGTITAFSLVMELAPTLTAIVIAGKIGAAITAELGTMKITEQLDALYTLGTNPVKFLVASRFLACLFILPMLTIIANIIGIYGGMFITTNLWEISPNTYWADVFNFMTIKTFFHGFIKSFFFALIIVVVACHKGFNTKTGAEGVGKATTSAVVSSIIFILISDYFLTSLFVSINIK
jgi:phospholipid/cholesterol/gamma-HCH transport system permease protein